MQEAGISLNELSAVVISSGPGSYTGLRIGMSVAKGICFACELPMISISTLELMAARAVIELGNNMALYCPMIDARRMEVYSALFDHDLNLLRQPAAIVMDENFLSDSNNEIYFFGDGALKCKSILPANFIYVENIFPSAAFMGVPAMKKFNLRQFENISLVEPVYLKEFHSNKINTEKQS
jgi:tRNA threonylcarbamoyladenosine biosynthesis protein TsaB